MRIPRIHLSIRSLMILIALVGLGMGFFQLHGRSLTFSKLAEDYASRKDLGFGRTMPILETREEYADWREKVGHQIRVHDAFYAALAEKYRRAARAPWLPVEPDPPAP